MLVSRGSWEGGVGMGADTWRQAGRQAGRCESSRVAVPASCTPDTSKIPRAFSEPVNSPLPCPTRTVPSKTPLPAMGCSPPTVSSE